MSNIENQIAAATRKRVARAVVYSCTTLYKVIRYLKAGDFDNSSSEWAFALSAGLIVPSGGVYVLSNAGRRVCGA